MTKRPVEPLAQIAPAAVLHEGDVQRRLQGDAPGAALGAWPPASAGVVAGGARAPTGPRRPAGWRAGPRPPRVAQHQGVGLGGVEQVVREPGAQPRPARSRWPRSAAWPRPPAPTPASSACWMLDSTMRRRGSGSVAQPGPVAQGDEAVVERPALAEAQRRRDHLGLHRLLGLAQRRAVLHRQQVVHDAPGVAQRLGQLGQRPGQALPGRRWRPAPAPRAPGPGGSPAGGRPARPARSEALSKRGGSGP